MSGHPRENRRSRLSPQLLSDVAFVAQAFNEVDPKSYEQWLNGFEMDLCAAREIAYWKIAARAFNGLLSEFPELERDGQLAAYRVTGRLLMGKSATQVISMPTPPLTQEHIVSLVSRFFEDEE